MFRCRLALASLLTLIGVLCLAAPADVAARTAVGLSAAPLATTSLARLAPERARHPGRDAAALGLPGFIEDGDDPDDDASDPIGGRASSRIGDGHRRCLGAGAEAGAAAARAHPSTGPPGT